MQSIEDLHSEAMNLAEEGFIAQRKGDRKKSEYFFRLALNLEQKAAEKLQLSIESEPSRSILYRSAASLAYNVNEFDLAERLIAKGLSGFPPEEIKVELKNLYEDVNCMNHLKSRGLIFEKNQWLFTIAGDAVMYGATAVDHLISRVDRVSSVFYRTVERMLYLPYRTAGGIDKKIKNLYGLYIKSFAPASFAVSFQIGTPDPQIPIPGFEKEHLLDSNSVVDEIMDCLELFEKEETEKLKIHFDDANYYENFMGLAKEIAPDGKNVKIVGFTSIRDGVDRPVALRKRRKQILIDSMDSELPSYEEDKELFTFTGLLMHANTPIRGKFGTVKLVENVTKNKIEIRVSVSIMKDVVQPYYEEIVTVHGYKLNGKNYLTEIYLENNQLE